jgi:hypothetical protein
VDVTGNLGGTARVDATPPVPVTAQALPLYAWISCLRLPSRLLAPGMAIQGARTVHSAGPAPASEIQPTHPPPPAASKPPGRRSSTAGLLYRFFPVGSARQSFFCKSSAGQVFEQVVLRSIGFSSLCSFYGSGAGHFAGAVRLALPTSGGEAAPAQHFGWQLCKWYSGRVALWLDGWQAACGSKHRGASPLVPRRTETWRLHPTVAAPRGSRKAASAFLSELGLGQPMLFNEYSVATYAWWPSDATALPILFCEACPFCAATHPRLTTGFYAHCMFAGAGAPRAPVPWDLIPVLLPRLFPPHNAYSAKRVCIFHSFPPCCSL